MNTNPIRVTLEKDDRELRSGLEASGIVTLVETRAQADVVLWHVPPTADELPEEWQELIDDPRAPAVVAVTDGHPQWFEAALALGVESALQVLDGRLRGVELLLRRHLRVSHALLIG